MSGRGRSLLGVLAVVCALAALGAWRLRERGLGARAEAWPLEEWLARLVRQFATPREERTRSNPVPSSPDALAAGRQHFADHCAQCHANDGGGHTPLGSGLYPKPPDLRSAPPRH